MVRVAVQDMKLGIEFAKKFDLKFQKTYNPPSIKIFKNFTNEQILSFIVGFIDGDGSICTRNQSASLRIQNHASWIDMHRFFLKNIQKIFKIDYGSVYIDKRGYSSLNICTKNCISLIFNFILKQKIPYLNRKWDKLK